MSARPSTAVSTAVLAVLGGQSLSAAARAHGCDVRSVRRAMRRIGIPAKPRKPVRAPESL